ncbi:MAG: PAS domain S-box protein [Candidatus Hydrogenedentes bacterium]|nr:PAS domain S-box protein [Candidatus Hydrogenedentota bacterium]
MKEKRNISLSTVVLLLGAMLFVGGLAVVYKFESSLVSGAVLGGIGTLVLLLSAGFLFWVVRELERSEERLRVIVESAHDGIVTTNEFGIIESVNARVTTLFGYRPGKLVGEHLSMLLSSAYGEREEGEYLLEYLDRKQMGEPGVTYVVHGLRQDGHQFHMDLAVTEARLGGERFYTVMLRDVTERVAAQRVLHQSKDELERRVKERTAALEESNVRLHEEITRRKELILELQTAIGEIKTLSGLLPICASCKKIRDDKGSWNQIEVFIRDHSDAEFSHGICPDCIRQLYPELQGPLSEL